MDFRDVTPIRHKSGLVIHLATYAGRDKSLSSEPKGRFELACLSLTRGALYRLSFSGIAYVRRDSNPRLKIKNLELNQLSYGRMTKQRV